MRSITIKQLHATTGAHVRQARKSRVPVMITDRGEPVAVLVHPAMLKPRQHPRAILPEYERMMARRPGSDLQDDLDAIRGER